MNLILIGFKHCGKSTLGKLLAEKLNKNFVDTDELIEKQESLSVREICLQQGEEYFREIEKEVIGNLIGLKDSVIAMGGGSVLDVNNQILLKKLGKMIYLNAPFEVIEKRLSNLPGFVESENQLLGIYEQRKSIYLQIADCEILVGNKSAEEIINEILITSSPYPPPPAKSMQEEGGRTL